MLESGAHALGCAVIPGGTGNTEQQLDGDRAFQARAAISARPTSSRSCSTPPRQAGKDASSLRRGAGVGRGAAAVAARRNWRRAASTVLQCYATADLGVVAYECEAAEGMIVNETLLVEIVRPGTGDPVAEAKWARSWSPRSIRTIR